MAFSVSIVTSVVRVIGRRYLLSRGRTRRHARFTLTIQLYVSFDLGPAKVLSCVEYPLGFPREQTRPFRYVSCPKRALA